MFDHFHIGLAARYIFIFVERYDGEPDLLIEWIVIISIIAYAEEHILGKDIGRGAAAYGAAGFVKYRSIKLVRAIILY